MKDWTLLALVQEFCKRQNIGSPGSVTVAQDEETLQLWGLLNEEVSELNERGDWPQLHRNYTFTHANGRDFLALNLYGPTAAEAEQTVPSGLKGITIKYPGQATIWCSTQREPVVGPVTMQDWTSMSAMTNLQPVYCWRMGNWGICIRPVPVVTVPPVTFMLDAIVREPVRKADGTGYTEDFQDDGDICALPGRVVLAGLRWRWRAEKGLPYAEHQRTYEGLILQELGNAGAGQIDLEGRCEDVTPGIIVPWGNWMVPR